MGEITQDDIGDVGDVLIRVTYHGISSNRVRVAIGHIGGGPGLCVIGDDVILEPHCGILGPVRVGHRVTIGAGIAWLRTSAE